MKARENPFRTELLLRVRYEPIGTTWEDILARCESLRFRAAIIGPHGSGKTTLLEDLESRLRERGFGTRLIRLDTQEPLFRPGFLGELFRGPGPRDIILFDGAEQLSLPRWLWFRWHARRAAGVIITTHRAGRLPTLWECRTSPELLARIASRLLGADSQTVRPRAELLFKARCGNLREALREWYDLMASA